jgi:ferric-dicitrate binding protein FerR (iron transport regulator)
MLPLTIDATSPSIRARRNVALALIAASAFVLLVVCGTWSTEMMSSQDGGVGGGGGAAELESVSAKAGALARVSGVQMVKDVKKVLQDVEATLQARVNSLNHHSFQQY